MHVALNAWFWDQPYTGSGQYLRQLVPALRQLDDTLRISLIMPDRIQNPEGDPPGVAVVAAHVPARGQIGKALFEQQSYSARTSPMRSDSTHVPDSGGPTQSR